MKVYLGPYKNFISIYTFTDKLKYLGFSELTIDRIEDWLEGSWLDRFLRWVDSKRDRKVKIKIHNYDTWNMDETVALITLPLLKQLKEHKHGAPMVDDKDVPERLRSHNAEEPATYKGDVDSLFFERWEWVLDEMIFAFENHLKDWDEEFWKESGEWHWEDTDIPTGDGDFFKEMITDREPVVDWTGREEKGKRIQYGFELFGKYFTGLWD